MRSCKHTNTIIYRGKQHCNVSKANIVEHVHVHVHVVEQHRTCTMYIYVRQSENIYSKVQIQAANLQNQKFKT